MKRFLPPYDNPAIAAAVLAFTLGLVAGCFQAWCRTMLSSMSDARESTSQQRSAIEGTGMIDL